MKPLALFSVVAASLFSLMLAPSSHGAPDSPPAPVPVPAVSAPGSAFGPLRQKLREGGEAVLFINGDSTSYSEHGPYYLLARAIGDDANCKVVLYRWAEWEVSKPSGPKDYAAPVVVREASGSATATLRVYLASLPGGVAGDMFAEARRAKALEGIPRPDCAILHQGHNMLNHSRAFPEDGSTARGLFFAAIGNTSLQWPGVPQVMVTQNPWRGSDRFRLVYDAMVDVATLQPAVELIDTYRLFVEAGKRADLYRDDIHPSDRTADANAGARLIADALLASWRATDKSEAPVSVPAAAPSPSPRLTWAETPGENLIANGDFAQGPGNEPEGWRASEGATVERVDADGQPALAIRPNGKQAAIFEKVLTREELQRLAGKTISVASLIRASSSQPRAFATVVCQSGGKRRTFAFGDVNSGKGGWVWLVTSGITIDGPATSADGAAETPEPVTLRFYPAFGLKPPESNDPLLIRRVIVTEGSLPCGLP
ncbi:hypothetical protein DB346_20855 [Verrucomicrobia bacterium LW23]|nr:hypothetical protein DB346_20855 [Verrucomicrobia bacterium LW23]